MGKYNEFHIVLNKSIKKIDNSFYFTLARSSVAF